MNMHLNAAALSYPIRHHDEHVRERIESTACPHHASVNKGGFAVCLVGSFGVGYMQVSVQADGAWK